MSNGIPGLARTYKSCAMEVEFSRCVERQPMITGNLTPLILFCFLWIGCGRNERMDLLYAQRCLSCHGPSGQGDGPVAASLPVRVPDFRDTGEKKNTPQIRRAIAEGRGIIPAFGPELRPAEITDMVQIVRFRSREGRNVSWWEKYDTLVVAHCNVPLELVLGYDEPAEPKQP